VLFFFFFFLNEHHTMKAYWAPVQLGIRICFSGATAAEVWRWPLYVVPFGMPWSVDIFHWELHTFLLNYLLQCLVVRVALSNGPHRGGNFSFYLRGDGGSPSSVSSFMCYLHKVHKIKTCWGSCICLYNLWKFAIRGQHKISGILHFGSCWSSITLKSWSSYWTLSQ